MGRDKRGIVRLAGNTENVMLNGRVQQDRKELEESLPGYVARNTA